MQLSINREAFDRAPLKAKSKCDVQAVNSAYLDNSKAGIRSYPRGVL
jgi:hypothetical protein